MGQRAEKKEMQKKELGAKGEKLASEYLAAQGYTIVAMNLTSPYGEIDLVAQKGKRLFFVEIKTRTGDTYGSALDAVTWQKQKKIRRNAEYWLLRRYDWKNFIPFLSVIALDEQPNGEFQIEFLPDAFE